MPSKSAKQRRFMAAAAHNPRVAKKAGIRQSVAREFNKADQGALKRATGGSVSMGGGRRGALGRVVGRIAPQSQKNPQTRMGNHMLSGTDATLAETGEGLRNIVGRMSRGRIAASKGGMVSKLMRRLDPFEAREARKTSEAAARKRKERAAERRKPYVVDEDGEILYDDPDDSGIQKLFQERKQKVLKRAEGGKVGTAMSALRALAKKYQSALEAGDTVLARRLKKQLDSAGVKDPEEEVGNQKAATFAKGGKVKGVKSLVKMFRARMDDREGYIREGKGATKEEAYKKLREEVARDNGEDTVDALLKEHGVTYRGRE